MKTLMLVDNYPPEMNANARIFAELAERLVKKNVAISVISSHPNFPKGKIFPGHKNKWRSQSMENGVRVIRVKTYMHPNKGFFKRTLDFVSFGFSAFFFGLFERKNDFVIGVTPQFFCAFFACLLAMVKRKPFLLILCDLWPDSIVSNNMMSQGFFFKMIKKLEFFIYRKASTIAVLSPYFRGYLTQAGINASKIVDFIAAPDDQFYPQEKKTSLLNKYHLQAKLVIGYIGTFGLSHNHKDILRVFQLTRRDDVHLLMIGDGAKKKDLSDFIAKNQLANVTIDGPIQAAEVPAYWSVCDVVIVPLAPTESNKTVIPSKLLEAMKMGLPAILYTPLGEATRFFAKSEACWHVESGNIEALHKLIDSLSNAIIKTKKEKALAFSRHFSREKQASILLDHMRAMHH